ncbi:MAG TPA: MFS transporter [Clostridia bacterium]|nr:MFS transporter [Clostridia bacterium]
MGKNNKDKLWSRGFMLIWQGQLVSTLGDAAYSIALGFWILKVTGSTALMGTLMATSALPGVLVSPFAGVLLDRMNKKIIMVLMDILRGIVMVLIAVEAYSGAIAVWMVFVAGILLSICGSLFRPGVNASLPDLLPEAKLSNANSMLSMVSTGANMIGNVIGGFLYQSLGAPLLFLFNGLSYLFSGVSISFVDLPKKRPEKSRNIFYDMKAGFHFMWKKKGLRYMLMMAAVINFFAYIAIVLFLPMFETTSYLGAGLYGVAMACFMGGCMVGYIALSIVTLSPAHRLHYFIAANALSTICFIAGVNQRLLGIMIPFLAMGGFFNSVVNVILLSSVQATTPNDMRGKVFAFLNMTTQSLTPLSMAIGGVLASFFPIRLIISLSFFVIMIFVTPFLFVKDFKNFINYKEKSNVNQTCEIKELN